MLSALGSDLNVETAIDVDLESALAPVLSDQFGDQGVVIDLSNGTIVVDLDQILGGEGSLNSLGPNTEVLSPDTINAILAGLGSAVDDLTQEIVNTVTAALNAAELTFTAEGEVLAVPPLPPVAALSISLQASLGTLSLARWDLMQHPSASHLPGWG